MMNLAPHQVNVDAQQLQIGGGGGVGVDSTIDSTHSRTMAGGSISSDREQQKLRPINSTVAKFSNDNGGVQKQQQQQQQQQQQEQSSQLKQSLQLNNDKEVHHQKKIITPLKKYSMVRQQSPDFNLPPIHTPINTSMRSTIPVEDSIPPIPSLPKPQPFGATTRRAISDNIPKQQQQQQSSSGQRRRSIFGQYFDVPRQGQQHHSHLNMVHPISASLHGRPRSQSLNDASSSSLGSTSSTHSCRSSSSSGRYQFPDLEPLDYRMFAPPQSHAVGSNLCGRFESVENHSDPSLLSSTEDLPPLPSPLQRFCGEPKHGRSLIHGMYPLIKPVSILRPSSFRRSAMATNNIDRSNGENSSTDHHSGSYHRKSSSSSSSSARSLTVTEVFGDDQKLQQQCQGDSSSNQCNNVRAIHDEDSFNLTDSFRPKGTLFSASVGEEYTENEERALLRRSLRNVGKLPTILSTGDMSVVDFDDSKDDEDLEMDREDGDDSDGRISSSFSSSSQRGGSNVRFDPRVTITEFEDEIQRCWYTDWELEMLKRETVLVAQKYLLAHPLEAMKYSEAKLDPLTGTYRKRALFSLPGLTSDTIQDVCQRASGNKTTANSLPTNKDELERLVDSQIKRILVVDPNSAILALFRKSMLTMFPHADVVVAQSRGAALQLLKKYVSFDIVVIEQCLDPTPSWRLASSHHDHRHRRNNTLPSAFSTPEIKNEMTFPVLRKPGSFTGEELFSSQPAGESRGPTTGAELLKLLVRKEHSNHILSKSKSGFITTSDMKMASGESSSIVDQRPASLLIGVSVKPDRDAKVLQRAGADIVWGKPPPKVSNALANILLSLLLSKRRAVST
eukprot:CAMPEP_0113451150 /NCGR_PEP_ID=MMETSP0014_2-20120614/6192_1 /TAXON_ID=2857 /ORGANISM="Nitzschia sp." /LENGTH=842 /DNA_ID=CAMNT_0000342501 /DNA_START=631 /DNA_END=3159 /DNA_ORIENTATION=- /assembly_acc=CAM_ASM_000159